MVKRRSMQPLEMNRVISDINRTRFRPIAFIHSSPVQIRIVNPFPTWVGKSINGPAIKCKRFLQSAQKGSKCRSIQDLGECGAAKRVFVELYNLNQPVRS